MQQALKVKANQATLDTVIDSIDEFLVKNGCPEEIRTLITIAAEEIYVNIAHYAYGNVEGEANVEMCVCPDPSRYRLTFRDTGKPFNPLEKEDPDLELPAEERPVGGLGIYMVRQMMDHVEYHYENGQNILILEKALE